MFMFSVRPFQGKLWCADDVLWCLFDEELAKGFKTATNLQSLLICRREFFVRKLRLRPAA